MTDNSKDWFHEPQIPLDTPPTEILVEIIRDWRRHFNPIEGYATLLSLAEHDRDVTEFLKLAIGNIQTSREFMDKVAEYIQRVHDEGKQAP